MFGDGCLELARHEAGVAGGIKQVIETGEQLVTSRVVEVQSTPDPAAERHEVGMPETLGQPAVASKDDAEQVVGVEFLARENAQLVEHG